MTGRSPLPSLSIALTELWNILNIFFFLSFAKQSRSCQNAIFQCGLGFFLLIYIYRSVEQIKYLIFDFGKLNWCTLVLCMYVCVYGVAYINVICLLFFFLLLYLCWNVLHNRGISIVWFVELNGSNCTDWMPFVWISIHVMPLQIHYYGEVSSNYIVRNKKLITFIEMIASFMLLNELQLHFIYFGLDIFYSQVFWNLLVSEKCNRLFDRQKRDIENVDLRFRLLIYFAKIVQLEILNWSFLIDMQEWTVKSMVGCYLSNDFKLHIKNNTANQFELLIIKICYIEFIALEWSGILLISSFIHDSRTNSFCCPSWQRLVHRHNDICYLLFEIQLLYSPKQSLLHSLYICSPSVCHRHLMIIRWP